MGTKSIAPLSINITRAEAIEKGLRRFNTGLPCKNGHYSDRQTTNGGCCACMSPKLGRVHVPEGWAKFGTYWNVPRSVTPAEAAYLIKRVQSWIHHVVEQLDLGTAPDLWDGTKAPNTRAPALPTNEG